MKPFKLFDVFRTGKASVAPHVASEMVLMLYRQSPPIFFGNYAVASLAGYQFWRFCPHGLVLGWVAGIYFLTALRIVVFLAFNIRVRQVAPATRWATIYASLTAISGCFWGAIGLIFFLPHNIIVIALICIVLSGMAGGSVASLSCYQPAYWAFALPAVLPFALRSLIYGGSLFSTLGVLALFLLAVNLAYSRTVNRTVRDSILLRFENSQLLDEVRVEQLRAVAADRAKSLFLASASHDLRQPAHAMSLFVSALHEISHRPNIDPAALQKLVGQLRQALGGMNLLLNKLLDISRLDTGIVTTSLDTFPLNNLFEGLRGEFEAAFEEKTIDLRIVSTSVWVSSDPIVLHQILSNLLSNALRYTRTGRVLVGCRRRRGAVEIQVLDTGIGIDAEHLPHIFEDFYQVANVTRNREQGLGLGLAIVRRSAELLGTPLDFTSVLSKGSKVSIRVSRSANPQFTIEPHSAVVPTWPRRTVLIIDDDEDVLSAMTLLLDILGHAVIPAETFDEALAAAAQYRTTIDLVLSDYRLGESVTGIDAIRSVTSILGRDVQAALITGDTSPERLREAGVSGFTILHKPLDADSFKKLFDADLVSSKSAITDAVPI